MNRSYNICKLFQKYKQETPIYNRIHTDYIGHIKGIDHIAFRNLKKENIINEPFLEKQNDLFSFKKYNAKAVWFKLNEGHNIYPNFKRLFASYYDGIENDASLNSDVKNIVTEIIREPDTQIDSHIYNMINQRNQYLAWTILHKNKINHVALQVHDIKKLVNDLLIDGYDFNQVNGEIIYKGLDDKLLQASLISSPVNYKFTDGTHQVPGAFVEFVQRIDDIEGFNNENATKIMNSTNN